VPRKGRGQPQALGTSGESVPQPRPDQIKKKGDGARCGGDRERGKAEEQSGTAKSRRHRQGRPFTSSFVTEPPIHFDVIS